MKILPLENVAARLAGMIGLTTTDMPSSWALAIPADNVMIIVHLGSLFHCARRKKPAVFVAGSVTV